MTFREVNQDYELMRTAEQGISVARKEAGMMLFPTTQVPTKGRKFLFYSLRGERDFLLLSGFMLSLPQRMDVHLCDCWVWEKILSLCISGSSKLSLFEPACLQDPHIYRASLYPEGGGDVPWSSAAWDGWLSSFEGDVKGLLTWFTLQVNFDQ